MPECIVKVLAGSAPLGAGPHANRYVKKWNPHSPFGEVWIDTVAEPWEARRFADLAQVLSEQRTVSRVQPRRPTDGKPNRPLTGLTVEIQSVKAAA
jgi:hypothetical protein